MKLNLVLIRKSTSATQCFYLPFVGIEVGEATDIYQYFRYICQYKFIIAKIQTYTRYFDAILRNTKVNKFINNIFDRVSTERVKNVVEKENIVRWLCIQLILAISWCD